MSKKSITTVKLILVAITIAIVFYNLGVSAVIKGMKPHATATGYEVEVFGQVYTYED